jgi:voltage-gated potassium channel
MWRAVVRSLATLGCALAIYYLLPLGAAEGRPAVQFVLFGLGVAGLAALVVWQVSRLLRTPADSDVRLQSLVVLLYLVVVFFAGSYYELATGSSTEQFADMRTKTDALYFTVSTMATVGYGDVHATGQLARGVVTAQMAFNVVFVAALVSVYGGELRRRAEMRRR